MRSYGQFCAVARALDIVGDRWTLLIVRDLVDGPRRYGELRDGLPGIASNLLADRLRDLQDHGIIDHDGERYALTARGAELDPVLDALVRWGAPLMAAGPGDDVFRPQWLKLALGRILHGVVVDRQTVIECDAGGHVVTVAAGSEGTTATDGPAPRADARVRGPAHAILLLFGSGRFDDARPVTVGGSRTAVRRVLKAVPR